MAEVRILLDPEDDLQVTAGLLERHDPARGRVTVHPTPSVSSPQAFAHDLLGALGRAVNRLGAEHLAGAEPAWRAAAAWIAADQIRDLAVLRADRLSARVWTMLLELCREADCRVLLVCHTRQVPAHLAAVLAGAGSQLLASLPQALDNHGARQHPGPPPDRAAGAAEAEDLPLFPYPDIGDYRRKAFAELGPDGFARTDAVYRHGRDTACLWLSDGPEMATAAGRRLGVQLFLARLVHDSPSRRHTLARLRGAQAGFRLHGYQLDIPPSERILDVLAGPGLNAPPFTDRTAALIRAGVAHPVIAAGIAVALVAGVQPQAVSSSPRESLSEQCDTLRLTWNPTARTLLLASEVSARAKAVTAMFHIPAAARPLLRAARHYSRPAPGRRPARRLFAATRFTNETISAAAANCNIQLSDRHSLEFLWQTRIACARAGPPRTGFEDDFAHDQAFSPPAGHGCRD